MLHRISKEGNHLLVCNFVYPALIIFVLLLFVPYYAYAQDISDIEQQTAIMQHTLKYRFGEDLKVGDMVRYTEESGGNGAELKVTDKKSGNLFIDEKAGSMLIHYQINPETMELIAITGTDDDGNDINIKPLGKERLEQIIAMFKTRMKQQGSTGQFVTWEEGSEREKVTTPSGSFECNYLHPAYSEMYASQIKGMEESLRAQGRSEDEIEKLVYQSEPRLYFCGNVPKLLPMTIAMGWMPWIESFAEIEGGLVESRHMAGMILAEYNR